MRLHKGKVSILGLILFVLVFAGCATFVKSKGSVFIGASANPAYAPQPSRNAEQAGHDTFSQDEINSIGKNIGIMTIPKFADSYNIQTHFVDARNIVAAGKAYGGNTKVLEYFNASFWYRQNNDGWKPYSDSFNKDWYLKDASGNPVAFYGVGNTVSDGNPPIGYMLDLSNPQYRAWAVATITQWMKSAPYSGVQFDSADALLGNVSRGSVSGGSSWNDYLCGSSYFVDASGNCPRVAQWNAGLASLLSEAGASLHPLGDFIRYNGIAPSASRGPSRNLGLLTNSDGTSNENFCYQAQIGGGKLTLTSLTDDISIMQQISAQNKVVFEITNYQIADNLKYGSYCLGGFLMGWQPGSSYWVYHQGYAYDISLTYPNIAEQNLNLGNPTAQYVASGAILARSFQNGLVVVNNSDAAATYNLPSKVVQFSNGTQGSVYAAGSQLTLPARSGAFFLNDSYVNPAGTGGSTPAGNGSPSGTNGQSDTSSGKQATNKTQTQIAGNVAANGDLSGGISLNTPAIAGVMKVEYYIDGKLVRTVTKFPDTSQLDTTQFTNGKHTLLTKYYHDDGSITTNTKNITVSNPGTREKLVTYVKRAALPSIGITLALALLFFIFHRFRFLVPRWFYHHSQTSNIITHASSTTATVYQAGTVITPTSSSGKQPNDH